jgi:hypothetical protein
MLSWIIVCVIILLIVYRFRQFLHQRPPSNLTGREFERNSPPSAVPILEYAAVESLAGRTCGFPDLLYFGMAVACYLLAGYAESIMPGGYHWDYEWEYASFLMTVAALSSIVLCIAGIAGIFTTGRKRVALVVLIGVWITGILPILMFFFAKRWLQRNFA